MHFCASGSIIIIMPNQFRCFRQPWAHFINRLSQIGTQESNCISSCVINELSMHSTAVWRNWVGMGVIKPISSVPLISRYFTIVKTLVTYHVHFWQELSCDDTCKYECDTNNLTGSFARSKTLLSEKLTNGTLVSPNPDLQYSSSHRVR